MIKLKIKLRKWTSLIHFLYGAGCVLLAVKCFPASLSLMLLFALYEYWDDYAHSMARDSEGADDWWEAFVVYSVGLLIVLILDYAGVLSIGWK